MDLPHSVDGQFVSAENSLTVVLESKTLPRRQLRLSPLWFLGSDTWRRRSISLMPLACLLVAGAWVPGFLLMLGFLLACLAVALGAFVFCVQLPLGYLVGCWRGSTRGSSVGRRVLGKAPFNGI